MRFQRSARKRNSLFDPSHVNRKRTWRQPTIKLRLEVLDGTEWATLCVLRDDYEPATRVWQRMSAFKHRWEQQSYFGAAPLRIVCEQISVEPKAAVSVPALLRIAA